MELLRKHAEKIRFAIVGGANTALDFLILFILVGLGFNAIVANFVSTSIAFVFSFFVNKSFTFNDTGKDVARQFVFFIVITVFSLWVIQPLIIVGIGTALIPLNWNDSLVLFIAKVVATLASLIWNYIFYTKFVFKKAGK